MNVKGKYAVNADVASAAEAARLHHGVVLARGKELSEVAIEIRRGESDLIPAKHAAVVEVARRDIRYHALDVLDVERSIYGKRVPLVADVVLLPAAKKRLAPYATAKAISSANAATDEASHTDRKRGKMRALPMAEKATNEQNANARKCR